jgi:glycerol uptake facilitator-like aquaporin
MGKSKSSKRKKYRRKNKCEHIGGEMWAVHREKFRERLRDYYPRYGLAVQLIIEFIFTTFLGGLFVWSYGLGNLGPIVFGLVLIGITYMGRRYSGAYYNPALVLAALINGREHLGAVQVNRIIKTILYSIVQYAGAVAGIAFTSLVLWQVPPPMAMMDFLSDPPSAARGFCIQIVSMAAFTMVFLSVTCKHAAITINDYYGMAIGFTWIGLCVIIGEYDTTGIALLNPAISAMTNVCRSIWNVESLFNAFIYFATDTLGAFIGGFLYYYINYFVKKSKLEIQKSVKE